MTSLNPAAVTARAAIRSIQWYTRTTPIARGRLWLSGLGMTMAEHLPGRHLVSTTDGRRLYADLSTGMAESLFFRGEYEPGVSSVMRRLVRPGDVCLDAGANFGWYTTLLRQLTGQTGSVHAFEPVPAIFDLLKANVALLGDGSGVSLNQMALGDSRNQGVMHLFPGLPDGHASLSAMGRDDASTTPCEVGTLDDYMETRGMERVDIAKVDVEGGELALLRGARRLLTQAIPPIWIMEMALATASGFGYRPNALIECLREHGDYRFFAVNELTGVLERIDGFAPDDIGAYVLCLPDARYGARFAALDS